MVFCLLVAIFIITIVIKTPDSGLDASKVRREVMTNHLDYTGADNAVTAIYLNFRLWDTLFEALVLLVSAVAVISFSRSDDDE
jgi:multicomponent Na+:H+ antiporter subunit B